MSLKLYEMTRLGLEPFLPALHRHVRLKLNDCVKNHPTTPKILDVGGRKSPYTIGLSGEITILDLPRDTELQHDLMLGINNKVINQIKKNRSNIEELILGDMTCSGLPDEHFDIVISVEVLEHVEKDDLFVKEVHRVLKQNGVFIMTTPNGDWVENNNPDHKRHYKRKELHDILSKQFGNVSIEYAVAGGQCRKLGLRAWSLKKPIKTATSIFGNVVNNIQSANESIKNRSERTHHLLALAKKS